MGMLVWNGSYEDFIKSIERAAEVYKEAVFNVAKEKADKAIAETYREFGQYQRQIIIDIFNNAVDQFYTSYKPDFYEREYGLYDVLNLEYDDRGLIFTGNNNRGIFDEGKMHGDRKGGDLFNKVFIQGWHGGAESSYRGDHPEPGIPYYRKPVGYYTYWGRRSVQTKSPYDIINEGLEYGAVPNMRAKLQAILDKKCKQAENEILKEVKILQKNIFG